MRNLYFFGATLVFVLLARWTPHPANFTPMLSLAVLAGLLGSNRWVSVFLPVLAALLSDSVLGFYPGAEWVYLAYGLSGLIVFAAWAGRAKYSFMLKGAVLSNILFFVLSNFGVWMSGLLYPKTSEGLLACYIAGLPFAINTLISTLLYGGILILVWKQINSKWGHPVLLKTHLLA